MASDIHINEPADANVREFWQLKSADALAIEQGVAASATFDRMFGGGAQLWADDAEFEAFVADLAAAASGSISPSRP